MTRDDWARIKALVGDALARPAADRSEYLTAECRGDERTRREAESLLAAALRAADLYEAPTLLVAGARLSATALGELPSPLPALLDGIEAPHRDAPPDSRFEGTERYRVRRQLGAGGMGVVYEVDDRERQQVVALKTLRRWQPADIYRLKREFRSLSGIAHPNLVSLYDLVADETHCFFTMELVHGATFVDYIRASGAADIDRVRRTLPQLVDGLRELHRRGKLHRDIKPSNVLVTPVGRVVILDFGLTSGRGRDDEPERGVAGTPAYLSPEQCLGHDPGRAGDWYSVGVTLYHALTGRVPFDGPLPEMVARKTTSDPAPVSQAAGHVPVDLADACMALLSRDPDRRSIGVDAISPASERASLAGDAIRKTAFVGREAYLDALAAALDGVKAGRSASVYVHGPSGIGKTALLQRFFDAHVSGTGCLALRSRCHEHEAVPYKGLDGVVDGLSRFLKGLSPAERAALVPSDAAALARLFPVLQTPDLASATRGAPETADPASLRARAFAALRELLDRVAVRHPLVIEIDDFHWSDADSAAFLAALLRPPVPASLLVLLAFRSEEIDAKPFLRALVDRADMWTRIGLPLAPMTPAEVATLISALLRSGVEASGEQRHAIAREAGGNPFLVEELTRAMALGAGSARGTLGDLLQRRLDTLPFGARAFLETLALCGRPVMAARVFEACGLDGDERPLVSRLRAAHLVRSARDAGRVEVYHDRIRETLAARVVAPHEIRRVHDAMARVLVAHGDDDPEALFEHYRAAGRTTLAAVQAAAAAAKASAVLAFDLAATFFRHALVLQPDAEQRTAWTVGLARTLENAGRPVEAAESYLDAAREAPAADQLEWQRKAAELLLIGGQIDRGLSVSEAVLKAAGVRLARGPFAAMASLAIRRHQLRWRGIAFDRGAGLPAAHDLRRIDACWSITVGLAMVDPLRAADLNVRQLLWALDVGDPFRIARALALEAGFSVIIPAAGGSRSSEDLSRAAMDLAGDVHYVAALASLWAGIGVFLRGRWREATPLCESAMTVLRDHCTGVLWELNLARSFFLFSLAYRGRLREVAGHLHGLSQSARERGNFYLELELSTRLSLVRLAANEPMEAERRANEGMARWSQHGFQRPHYHHLLTLIQTRLYRGLPREAWELIERHEGVLGQPLFRRVQHTRIEVAIFRARCALAMAAAGEDPTRMRAIAARDAARVERERMPWSMPFAWLIRATVAHQEDRARAAADGLAAAIAGFDAVDMQLYAAVCRRRLGALAGGGEGRTLIAESERWMATEEIRNPAAMSRLLAPGLPEP